MNGSILRNLKIYQYLHYISSLNRFTFCYCRTVDVESQRIVLREIDPEKDDLRNYLTWMQDTHANPFIESVRADYSLVELLTYIRGKNHDKSVILWGIFLREDHRQIGTIKLEPIDFDLKTAWLGILIGESNFRGSGYGREAIEAVLSFSKTKLNLIKIYLGVDPANTVALKLYESIGFVNNPEKQNTLFFNLV